MAYRDSLKGCLREIETIFNYWKCDRLAILHIPKGKYYSVLTMPELEKYMDQGEAEEARLLFNGSLRELQTFTLAQYRQQELPLNEEPNPNDQPAETPAKPEEVAQAITPPTENTENREQQRDNNPE